MPNRNLIPTELRDLFGPLLADVRAKLDAASSGGPAGSQSLSTGTNDTSLVPAQDQVS
jgi:hypothetical protein